MNLENILKTALNNNSGCSFPEPQDLELPLPDGIGIQKRGKLNPIKTENIGFQENMWRKLEKGELINDDGSQMTKKQLQELLKKLEN